MVCDWDCGNDCDRDCDNDCDEDCERGCHRDCKTVAFAKGRPRQERGAAGKGPDQRGWAGIGEGPAKTFASSFL